MSREYTQALELEGLHAERHERALHRRERLRGQPAAAVSDERSVSRQAMRTLSGWLLALVFAANVAIITGLWLHDGGVTGINSVGAALTSIGRITGLLGAYLLLVQVLLLARLPILEWVVGFDRLTVWHRVNGKLCLYLVLAHVGFITAGYALLDRISIPTEASMLLGSYPGMMAALVGTVLLILVVVTSIVIVKRRLRYEAWYLVHLLAYAGIALSWFHQIPTGNNLVLNPMAAAYWTGLYVGSLQLLILFRLVQPALRNWWHGMRVERVVTEGPDVTSIHITGRHLEWLNARAGQFFLWRFLSRERWWGSHPFSLSAAPDGKTLRITVKNLGDFSGRLAELKPGTRVIAEGPFGHFTAEERSRDRVVLIAGGIGITPVRALIEELCGDVVLIYRAVHEDELIFRDELERLGRERGVNVRYVVGDHRAPENRHLLSAAHLRQLLPDIGSREIYLCGPPAMMRQLETNVRHAGVPARHIHTDRFAF